MKILLYGCTYSTWITYFIDNFLKKEDYDVWILKTSNKEEYIQRFKEQGVHLIECPSKIMDWHDGKLKGNFFVILYIHYLQVKTIVKSGKYDLINLHYVDIVDIVDVFLLKCLTKAKLLVSYWGDDLLRFTDRILHFLGIFAKHADYVTFDNDDLKIKFHKVYKWAEKANSETVLFGLPILDIIREKQNNVSGIEIRKKWEFPENKTIIAIGYNAIPQQQHIAVLNSIEKLENEIKERIFILLQMSYGYGGTEEYKKSVADAAKKAGCQYKVIDSFLSDEEIADLRIVTDIFIHAQLTDAFSGSICENLFAGTILLNARWLRYQEFVDYNFKYLEFEEIDEVAQIIKEVLEHGFDVSGNSNLIWKLRSWDACMPKWKRIYRKVLEKDEKDVGDRG